MNINKAFVEVIYAWIEKRKKPEIAIGGNLIIGIRTKVRENPKRKELLMSYFDRTIQKEFLTDKEIKTLAMISEVYDYKREVFEERIIKKNRWYKFKTDIFDAFPLTLASSCKLTFKWKDEVLLHSKHDPRKMELAILAIKEGVDYLDFLLPEIGGYEKLTGEKFFVLYPLLEDEKDTVEAVKGERNFYTIVPVNRIPRDLTRKEFLEVLSSPPHRFLFVTTERMSYVLDTEKEKIRGILDISLENRQKQDEELGLLFWEYGESLVAKVYLYDDFILKGKPEKEGEFYKTEEFLTPQEFATEEFKKCEYHSGYAFGNFFVPVMSWT